MPLKPQPEAEGAMQDAGDVAALGRRLTRLGYVLLAGALLAFAWAVGFSRGVDGLLEGLVVAVAGFLLPAVALLWIGWVLASASRDPEFELPPDEVAQAPRRRRLGRLMSYLLALGAVALALVIRSWLTPYMSGTMLSPTFLLAITVSAWVGGMGPALLATAISVPTLWFVFLREGTPAGEFVRTGDAIGLALFATVALSIAGIASALRITQSRSARLRADVRAGAAALDESEARFREMADDAPAMIWMSDPDGKCTHLSRAWLEFTGRRLDEELGDGWIQSVHPQDVNRCLATFRQAVQRREPFRMEYRLRRHDGSYRRVVDQGRPRIDGEARFVGFIGACMETMDTSAPAVTTR